MNEDVLIQLLQDINRDNVRFGTIEVSLHPTTVALQITSLQLIVAGTLIRLIKHLTTT